MQLLDRREVENIEKNNKAARNTIIALVIGYIILMILCKITGLPKYDVEASYEEQMQEEMQEDMHIEFHNEYGY
jgi:hypothetical protein